jgi:hypothetical protein
MSAASRRGVVERARALRRPAVASRACRNSDLLRDMPVTLGTPRRWDAARVCLQTSLDGRFGQKAEGLSLLEGSSVIRLYPSKAGRAADPRCANRVYPPRWPCTADAPRRGGTGAGGKEEEGRG